MVNYSRKKKNKLNRDLNKVSDNLINVCNEILVDRENECNCFLTECGRTTFCENCLKMITKCHLWRRNITGRLLLYHSKIYFDYKIKKIEIFFNIF